MPVMTKPKAKTTVALMNANIIYLPVYVVLNMT